MAFDFNELINPSGSALVSKNDRIRYYAEEGSFNFDTKVQEPGDPFITSYKYDSIGIDKSGERYRFLRRTFSDLNKYLVTSFVPHSKSDFTQLDFFFVENINNANAKVISSTRTVFSTQKLFGKMMIRIH